MSNQLIKTTELGKENVFPRTRILDLFDDISGLKLIDILKSFNMMFVPYLWNKPYTRNQISPELRRQGLWLTYVIDNTVYTEWYDEVAIDDTNWGSDSNWRQGSNALVGDLSVSPNGTWVINGEDSGITIKGDKGDSPVIRIYNNKILVSYDKGIIYEDLNNTPIYTTFRTNDNRLQVSTDLGNTWENCSEPIAAWFRWADADGTGNIGKVLISRDLLNWEDLSPIMINNLYIKGYVSTIGDLPSSAAIGDIYMVGPTYDESDTTHVYPHYRMWVKQSSGWVDNGEYQSNILIVLTTGLETGITMSLKAITNVITNTIKEQDQKLSELAEKTYGIESLKHKENVKVGGTKDYDVSSYWNSDNNLFLIAPVAEDFVVTKIKIHVVKHANAQYKFKLITVTPTGKMPITSISDEITLSAPEGDSDDQIVTLQTPFEVPAGQGFGIITSDGYWTRSQTSTNTDDLIGIIRTSYVSYSNAVIDSSTLPYSMSFTNHFKFSFTFYNERMVFNDFVLQSKFDVKIDEIEGYIDEQDTQLETRVSNLENNINETLEPLIEEEQFIVDGFSDFTPASSSYTKGNVVLFQKVFTIDRTINQIKARIRKTSDATYRIKLCSFIENDSKGFKITAISDSIQFETPKEDYETQTVDVNFTVAAGARLGILIDTPYAFMVNYLGNACNIRQETTPYDNATVGTVYWSGYTPGSVSFASAFQFTPYYQKRYIPEFTKQSKYEEDASVLDTRLDVMQTEIDVANNEELVWYKGSWYRGSFNVSINTYVSIKKALYCTKGTVISSGFNFNIVEVIDNVVSSSNLVENVYNYRFTEDKYVVLSVDLGSVNAITQGQEAAYAHSDFIIIGKDDRNEFTNFGNKGNELINNMEIRRVPMITKNEQWMTHVGSMMFDDADNKILWVSYYAKNYNVPNPTKEDASDANTYCCLAKIHLYDPSKPIEYCEILKANTTVAGFENGALPPYDPSIAHIEGDTITVMFEYYEGNRETGQRGLATAIISKTAFETAINSGETSTLSGLKICNPTSISKHILAYNGVQYNLDCAGVKSFYDTFSGGSIALPHNLCIATHPVLYNGYYYVTFQDIFDNTGLKPILMKTQDFVNWDFVKAFTEIVNRGGTVESSIVIKNDILYFSSRQTDSGSIYLLYDMVNNMLLFPPRNIPMGISIKTANVLYNDRVLCISNMNCVFEAGVDGNRKNMGIYEIFENGNIKLISTLKNDAGMHYPDFAQNNRELYLLFSEDRRYLDRETQRTNLTVARILV